MISKYRARGQAGDRGGRPGVDQGLSIPLDYNSGIAIRQLA